MTDRTEAQLRNNRPFVEDQLRVDSAYFNRLAEGQHPEFLWTGCSDSRVPPDRITGTGPGPGDMFALRGWVFELASGRIAALTGSIDNDEAMSSVCKFHGAQAALA